MTKIKKLPQNIVNLIAAGEVVERPASALKELIENSIDAQADKIIVRIGKAGVEYIEVEDNGVGMTEDDAIMAFEQHATSKIQTEEDLNHIYTLGFRGEALASISSVCQELVIETKSKDNTAIKAIKNNLGISTKISQKVDIGAIIRVNGLFENIPARKKFLKSEQVEFKHISQTFINTALPHLNIHFELWHNDKEIYKLTKVNNFKDRIFEIWGNTISKHIFEPVEYSSPGLKITAFLGSTEVGRKGGDIQYIFVNKRCISNKTIYQAAQQAYRGFLHKDLKPTYYYFIDLDASEVDVNIHPRKNEVRFNNSQIIFQAIYSITRKTLENKTKNLITETLSQEIQENVPNVYFKSNSSNLISKDTSRYTEYNESRSSYISEKKAKPTVADALSFTRILIEQPANEEMSLSLKKSQSNFSAIQIFNTYILFEKDDKLIFVDQHAAAEKITFEKLYSNYGAIKTKPLLVPEIINLKKHEKDEILNRKEELSKSGIILEDFGGESIQILEIPEIIEKIDTSYYLHEILNPGNDFEKSFDKGEYANLTYEAYILLATEACHGSIRAGQKLSAEEMRNILNELLKLKNPYNCPHGRPVMWELDRTEIEKNFKRKL